MGQFNKIREAAFAGGCFWCIESAFAEFEGVETVQSGYMTDVDGKKREAVVVKYDSTLVSYSRLLDHFWKQIDPTDEGGQFADRGYQYTTAIYYYNEEQKNIASKSLDELEKSGMFGEKIATRIEEVGQFSLAEEMHKEFWKKHPMRYKFYREASGRNKYLRAKWK